MKSLVTNKDEISLYQKRLISNLRKACRNRIDCNIGYQGSSESLAAYYSEELDFWFASKRSPNRYWNAFGLGRPRANSSNSIAVEINFPFRGLNRRIAGAFVKSESRGGNNTLVLHRGKIGGGRVGIGKQLFWEEYRGDILQAEDGEYITDFIFLGALDSPSLARRIRDFVSEVHRIKSQAAEFKKVANAKAAVPGFNEELTGTFTRKRTDESQYERTHGDVVNALAAEVEKALYKTANNQQIDLMIISGTKTRAIFEIKTSSSAQNIYTALGQLMINRMPHDQKAKLVMVLPERLNKSLQAHLNKLGVQLLYYQWEKEQPHFPDLRRFLQQF